MIINLNEPQDCNGLCRIIQKVIDRHIKTTGSQAQALSIKVVDILESKSHIPKLEFKSNE